MQGDLDQLSFDVVLDGKDADAILTGGGEPDKRVATQITGLRLRLNDTERTTISLISPDGKNLLWAGETGDRFLDSASLPRGSLNN
jgi:hypothetical protein